MMYTRTKSDVASELRSYAQRLRDDNYDVNLLAEAANLLDGQDIPAPEPTNPWSDDPASNFA